VQCCFSTMKLAIVALCVTTASADYTDPNQKPWAGNSTDRHAHSVSGKSCYRHESNMFRHEPANIAACQEICTATEEPEACNMVAYAKLACPKGQARLNGPLNDCADCVSDADFAKGKGCGYICSHITCTHSQSEAHRCPAQKMYEDSQFDNTATQDIAYSTQNMFFTSKKFRPIPATECTQGDDYKGPFYTTRTTFPRGAGSHYQPNGYATQETVCVMGRGGHACKATGDPAAPCSCYPTKKPLSATPGAAQQVTCNSDQWLDGTTCKSCPVAAAGVQGYKCNGTTKTPYGWDGVQRRKKGAGTWSSIKQNKHCIDPTNSKPNRGRGAQIGGSHSRPSFTIAQAKTKCKNDETCAGIMDWNTNTNKRVWYKCTYKKSNPAESGANAPYIKTKKNRDMYVITRDNNVQCNKNSDCAGASQCKNNNQCETP